jgi:predicted Zn-dependent protease
MSTEKIDLIEKELKLKEIVEYEIFLREKAVYETIFLKDKSDNEREINDFEYFIRILSQKDNETGVGVVKGNSLKKNDIERMIDTALKLSKINVGPKYYFPHAQSLRSMENVDTSIVKDPIGVKNDLKEQLISEIKQQKGITPTFGRFRIHHYNKYLRNSNHSDLKAANTFFFIEFSLKAQKEENLAEYWTVNYYKEKEHLNFEERIKKWADIAKETLRAEIPKPNSNAIVIFPPHILRLALNPVIGFHSSGQASYEKISRFELNSKISTDNFTLIDDGLLKGALNSSSWDGEGNAHQRTEIIHNGIFKNKLYDQKYSILENTNSTGNGNRALNGTIINSVSNFQIPTGDISLDEMISNIEEGYYIEKFSWLNPDDISGFFGAEIRNGWFIKNGKIKNPIKLGNISGNIFDMLKNILYISKEREFSENTQFPYIAFSNLTVSS